MTKYWKKFTAEKKMGGIKNYNLPYLHKVRPSYRRSLQLSKENIHFKTWNFLILSTFVCHSCPPGSGYTDWIRIQYGSGSETLIGINFILGQQSSREKFVLQSFLTISLEILKKERGNAVWWWIVTDRNRVACTSMESNNLFCKFILIWGVWKIWLWGKGEENLPS